MPSEATNGLAEVLDRLERAVAALEEAVASAGVNGQSRPLREATRAEIAEMAALRDLHQAVSSKLDETIAQLKVIVGEK